MTSENSGIQKSTIKQYNADNTVFLSPFSQDGTQRVAELVHLPISSGTGTSFPTLLNPFDDNNKDMIQMVLNKAVRDKHNLEDCPGLVLSLVLREEKIQFLLPRREGVLIGRMILRRPNKGITSTRSGARGATFSYPDGGSKNSLHMSLRKSTICLPRVAGGLRVWQFAMILMDLALGIWQLVRQKLPRMATIRLLFRHQDPARLLKDKLRDEDFGAAGM